MTAISHPERRLLVPPAPQPRIKDLSWYSVLAAFRTDGLRIWPQRAYEEDVHARSILGRPTYLLNNPSLIRHVLVDRDANYGRTPAGIRLLRPLMGGRPAAQPRRPVAASAADAGACLHAA